MEDQIISFETAKLAKEKGFDEKCSVLTYTNQKDVNYKIPQYRNSKSQNSHLSGMITLPTQSLLQRWLREVHNIHIRITPFIGGGSGIDEVFEVEILNFYKDLKQIGFVYDKYEDALEAGLFEALKLI